MEKVTREELTGLSREELIELILLASTTVNDTVEATQDLISEANAVAVGSKKLIEAANETIQKQFETILWMSNYIRELEAERDRKYKRLEPLC